MKKLITFMSLLLVVGCDAEGKLGVEESPAWHRRTSLEDKISYFRPKCVAYGYVEGSSEMSRCIQKEVGESEGNARARLAEGAAQAQASFNRPRRTQTCTSFGRTIHCY